MDFFDLRSADTANEAICFIRNIHKAPINPQPKQGASGHSKRPSRAHIYLSAIRHSYKSASPELPVDSVFAFALFNGQIGGPPCFFITGFAIGFGYNRCLSIPNIDQLTSFPLLKAVEGSISGADLLESEKTYFKPQADKSWVAAGVLFNSFKMIDSVAILTASWGSDVEINLIGRSVLNIPFNSNSTPIAHAGAFLRLISYNYLSM